MKRVATALVGIPLTLAIVVYGPDWLLAVVVAGVAAVCFEELFHMAELRTGARSGRWAAALAAAAAGSFIGGPEWVLFVLPAAFMVLGAACALEGPLESALVRLSSGALGLLYCGALPGFLLMLPRGAIVTLLGLIWAGDAAAYYGGRAFGRHPLAPSVSPKKTVEGAFAGLGFSMIAGVALGWRLMDENALALLAASFAAAAAGQIGDLAESALKRSAGVKDSSTLLPGHGGMLDRLDSLLFAAPVFYWFLYS